MLHIILDLLEMILQGVYKFQRFYDLRGSFATISLRSGCEIKDIAEILGHRRIETTEKYYISSTDDDKIKVTKSIENSYTISTL